VIPLRDTIPSSRFPAVTLLLIVANVASFLYFLSLGPRTETFLQSFGLTPAYVIYDVTHHLYLRVAVPFVSSQFLHGGWLHLIGNMWFLWIFGNNVEDKMGHRRFLGFYLLCGICAALGQVWSAPSSVMPMVGASGAIAGVLGAYFLLFPHAKVLTLIPLFIVFTTVEIPAVLFLGFWFVMQFLNGTMAFSEAGSGGTGGGVAWWAHVGGFASGMALVFPFRKYR
jgi:membrane associated rhomboid family serine protease